MSFWKKALLINLAIILAILASLTIFFATPTGRPVFKTLLLLPEILSQAPIHPLRWMTKDPVVEGLSFLSENRKHKIRIYRPDDSEKHSTAILIISALAPDSELIEKYAKSFARTGFVVVYPEIPQIAAGETTVQNITDLKNLFEFLEKQSFVDPEKIGFIGICGGGAYSLLAAEDELIADKVKYVVTVSPYFDLKTVSQGVFTKSVSLDEKLSSWSPNPLTVEKLKFIYGDFLQNEEEKVQLENLLKGVSKESTSERVDKIYQLMINSSADRFEYFWNNLPLDLTEYFASLSPSTNIKNLKAKTYILADRKDTYFSSIEGLALKSSLPVSQVSYIDLNMLEHTQLIRKLPRLQAVWDLVRLTLYTSNILREIS